MLRLSQIWKYSDQALSVVLASKGYTLSGKENYDKTLVAYILYNQQQIVTVDSLKLKKLYDEYKGDINIISEKLAFVSEDLVGNVFNESGLVGMLDQFYQEKYLYTLTNNNSGSSTLCQYFLPDLTLVSSSNLDIALDYHKINMAVSGDTVYVIQKGRYEREILLCVMAKGKTTKIISLKDMGFVNFSALPGIAIFGDQILVYNQLCEIRIYDIVTLEKLNTTVPSGNSFYFGEVPFAILDSHHFAIGCRGSTKIYEKNNVEPVATIAVRCMSLSETKTKLGNNLYIGNGNGVSVMSWDGKEAKLLRVLNHQNPDRILSNDKYLVIVIEDYLILYTINSDGDEEYLKTEKLSDLEQLTLYDNFLISADPYSNSIKVIELPDIEVVSERDVIMNAITIS
jgi:hypothetical protein